MIAAASGQVQISLYPRAGLLAPDEYFYKIFQKFVDECHREGRWQLPPGRSG